MNSKLSSLVAALAMAFGSAAPAGTLAPTLQHAMKLAGDQGDLPVIVQFAEQVDIEALRLDAARTAESLFPDDTKKSTKERVKLIRKTLVQDLKKQAKDSAKQVEKFLKSHKENRKLKLLWSRNSVVGEVPIRLLPELAELPGVEVVRWDATIQGPGPSSAPTGVTDWNLPATGVQGLWDLGHAGQGVVVASLDTGVDASHPALGPRWRGGSNSWFDPNGQHATPADVNGHGTQVMGLMVGGDTFGYQVGMAPDAQWIAAKIFNDAFPPVASLSGIHEAYQWVLDPDDNPATDDAPDIVNNSWNLTGTINQCNQEFSTDLALLAASDIAVVFAGGNYGPGADTSVSPANDPSVLAVGSVDINLDVDFQSSRGAGACDGGIFPHLMAPGEQVMTADRVPTYLNWVSGTSFAAPHVSGGMAVLKGAFPEATATQLKSALTETALDLGVGGPDHDYGNGLIDLAAAYDWLALQFDITPGSDPTSFQFSAADVQHRRERGHPGGDGHSHRQQRRRGIRRLRDRRWNGHRGNRL